MVAKLTIALFALVVFLGVVFTVAFWYFDRREAREHERDMTQMEQDFEMLTEVETDPIDRELDRERE